MSRSVNRSPQSLSSQYTRAVSASDMFIQLLPAGQARAVGAHPCAGKGYPGNPHDQSAQVELGWMAAARRARAPVVRV
eukprot:scaffold15601_cov124-Isochrysis_galbana.AAC.1